MENRLTPSVSASFQVTSDWGAGFVASIKINNDEPIPILNWRLEFDFPNQITEIWNGRIGSHVGTHYAIRNASWNAVIPPNGHVDFGFQGNTGNAQAGPSDCIFNGFPLP
jgi:cellulase/cellobiase CelA1